MIEVKNIVNRDITGIPLQDYWIQMQVQMEVCDLDECDFIETRIKEYPDKADFYADESGKSKGVILYLVSKTCLGNKPKYVSRFLIRNTNLFSLGIFQIMVSHSG